LAAPRAHRGMSALAGAQAQSSARSQLSAESKTLREGGLKPDAATYG